MKLTIFNCFIILLNSFMLFKVVPKRVALASIPSSNTYLRDDSDTSAFEKISPIVLSKEEQELEKFTSWYNLDYQVTKMMNDARSKKGASVRPVLVKEPTDSIPWLAIKYDDCTSRTCITRNYGHFQPLKDGKKWRIRVVEYPDAYKLMNQVSDWVLKDPQEIPVTIRDYVLTYYPTALEEQRKHGIPWQITLGQAVLESGINSDLAVKYGNHFGIKSHRGWTGKVKSFGDEKVNGRKIQYGFCVFNNAQESFSYHSAFLIQNKRYSTLWNYKPDSTYTYLHKPIARNFWNKKQWKPVWADIDGREVLLQYGKTYKVDGITASTIILSTAGYGSDHKYAKGLRRTINKFCQKKPK